MIISAPFTPSGRLLLFFESSIVTGPMVRSGPLYKAYVRGPTSVHLDIPRGCIVQAKTHRSVNRDGKIRKTSSDTYVVSTPDSGDYKYTSGNLYEVRTASDFWECEMNENDLIRMRDTSRGLLDVHYSETGFHLTISSKEKPLIRFVYDSDTTVPR